MADETIPEIPAQIEKLLTNEEIENIQSLTGWAVGTVTLFEDSRKKESIENAFIELCNGNGRARNVGGVNYLAVVDGDLREGKAYPSFDTVAGNEPGWFVEQFEQPSDPDVGERYPDTPGVISE